MTEGPKSYGVWWKLSLSCICLWGSPIKSLKQMNDAPQLVADLKGEFQIPERACDLLYTLLSHQPTFPLHNKRVWGECSANAVCRWIPGLHFAGEVWLTRVCAGTLSQHTWLNPVCFGSSATAADAKEVVKEALRLRRLVVEEEQQVPGKIKKTKKETIASMNFWWQYSVFSN